MTQKILLSLVAIIMLVLTIRKGDKLTIILTSGLTLGVLLSWTGIPIVITIGLMIYMLTTLLISFKALKSQSLQKFNRASIVVTGIWAFGVNLFAIMGWPYESEVRLSMIIPIILFFILTIKGIIKNKEFGYMTILNFEFILRVIR